jgi:tetratricopeptide (TPR) repeat protein
MQAKKAQYILVAAAAGLIVLIMFFANTTPPAQEPEVVTANTKADEGHFESQVDASMAALPGEQKDLAEKWAKDADSNPSLYDSLINLWDNVKKPDIAAWFSEKAAEKKRTEDAWAYAGKRYYTAVGFVKADEQGALYANAIRCYNKALEMDPNDLDTKTSLAACYVEGTAQPMTGITMLREVIAADSNNVNAQLQLAFFSLKSNQLDKAIMRFKKVLELDPHNLEVYLYLADVYERSGDKNNAIKNLEKYVSLTDDITVKTEVQGYINKLKNSN